jgi:hypothetical protein
VVVEMQLNAPDLFSGPPVALGLLKDNPDHHGTVFVSDLSSVVVMSDQSQNPETGNMRREAAVYVQQAARSGQMTSFPSSAAISSAMIFNATTQSDIVLASIPLLIDEQEKSRTTTLDAGNSVLISAVMPSRSVDRLRYWSTVKAALVFSFAEFIQILAAGLWMGYLTKKTQSV